MKTSHIGAVVLAVMVGFLAFQNCAPPKAYDDTSNVQFQDLSQLADELKTLAESDLRCTVVTDCRLVAVGMSPCGGPDYFQLASIKNAQYNSVMSLAQEYSYQDKIQTSPDTVGICRMAVPDTVRCESNVCVTD